MLKFVEFLRNIKLNINTINPGCLVKVVLGNESCDLDSMTCTLVYAYYLSTLHENNKTLIIPMINKMKHLFPIRVENLYLLEKYKVPLELLIFRDTVLLETLHRQCNLKLVLVDHHVLANYDKYLMSTVHEIIDHRPIDPNECYEDDVKKEIEMVGSCCTLIARRIGTDKSISKPLAGMLYDVITFDTIGFKESAGKVKPLDLEMAEKLETILDLPINNIELRTERFEEIWNAHKDISKLTSEQLLYKDLKIIGRVSIPGLPILVKNFLTRGDAIEAIESFARANKARAVLMMGLEVHDDQVKRDMALYTLDKTIASNMKENLMSKFETANEPSSLPNVLYFKQNNPLLSRKQLIPLLSLIL